MVIPQTLASRRAMVVMVSNAMNRAEMSADAAAPDSGVDLNQGKPAQRRMRMIHSRHLTGLTRRRESTGAAETLAQEDAARAGMQGLVLVSDNRVPVVSRA